MSFSGYMLAMRPYADIPGVMDGRIYDVQSPVFRARRKKLKGYQKAHRK